MTLQNNAIVYALSANQELGKKVCKLLNTNLGDINLLKFPSGEILASPNSTVRGKQIFIIQSTCPPVNDNLMELLIFIDALKKASAKEINIFIPYFGYARQDRKSKPREPITSKLVADLLNTAGAYRVITFDLHAAQIQGFFNCIEDEMTAIPLLRHAVINDSSVDKKNLVVVSPDHGGVNRARRFAEKLEAPIAIIDKRRNSAYQPEVMNIIGSVEGKTCLIVDDMIDSAGSAVVASRALKQNGCKDVYMAATHALFSNPAYERLTKEKAFKRIYVTDSIPLDEKFVNNKDVDVQVVSISNLISKAILSINNDSSLSNAYEEYKSDLLK